ncbi:MAG: hypothetical protein BWY49_00775 [Candidatus Omnitrophica bacterium ADurb.Bin314]|nr:MAG: hypothetical protein BWY49_00775 [Candidatus Omnitrophica bacterium ADurb.Bin314]
MREIAHDVPDFGLVIEAAAGHDEIRDVEDLHRVFIDSALFHPAEKHRDVPVRDALSFAEAPDPRRDRDRLADLRVFFPSFIFPEVRHEHLHGLRGHRSRPFFRPGLQLLEREIPVLPPKLAKDRVYFFEEAGTASEVLDKRDSHTRFSGTEFFVEFKEDPRLSAPKTVDRLFVIPYREHIRSRGEKSDKSHLQVIRILELIDQDELEPPAVAFPHLLARGTGIRKKGDSTALEIVKIKAVLFFLRRLIGPLEFKGQRFKFLGPRFGERFDLHGRQRVREIAPLFPSVFVFAGILFSPLTEITEGLPVPKGLILETDP